MEQNAWSQHGDSLSRILLTLRVGVYQLLIKAYEKPVIKSV